jgi:hypothetical protein
MNPAIFHRTLSGATGGIVGWFLAALLAWGLQGPLATLGGAGQLVPYAILLSVSTGLFITMTTRYQAGGNQSPVEVMLVVMVGIVVGGLVGLGAGWIFTATGSVAVGRALSTVLVGTIVGAIAGLNADDFRGRQVLLTLLGGVIGGCVGAVVQFLNPASMGANDIYASAACWTIAMGCVGLFASLLPNAASAAYFQFDTSTHTKTQYKFAGKRWTLLPNSVIEMGFHPKLGNVPNIRLIDKDTVAPWHAIVRHTDASGYVIEPHPETDGKPIRVDGRPLRERARLRNGSQVQLGSTTLTFRLKKGDA